MLLCQQVRGWSQAVLFEEPPLIVTRVFRTKKGLQIQRLEGPRKFESGRLDSNQRPLRPERSALPGCATSRSEIKCGNEGLQK